MADLDERLALLAASCSWYELKPFYAHSGDKAAFTVVIKEFDRSFSESAVFIEDTPSAAVAKALEYCAIKAAAEMPKKTNRFRKVPK